MAKGRWCWPQRCPWTGWQQCRSTGWGICGICVVRIPIWFQGWRLMKCRSTIVPHGQWPLQQWRWHLSISISHRMRSSQFWFVWVRWGDCLQWSGIVLRRSWFGNIHGKWTVHRRYNRDRHCLTSRKFWEEALNHRHVPYTGYHGPIRSWYWGQVLYSKLKHFLTCVRNL